MKGIDEDFGQKLEVHVCKTLYIRCDRERDLGEFNFKLLVICRDIGTWDLDKNFKQPKVRRMMGMT